MDHNTPPGDRLELVHRAQSLRIRVASILLPEVEQVYRTSLGYTPSEAASLIERTKDFVALVAAWGTLSPSPPPLPPGDVADGLRELLLLHEAHTRLVHALGTSPRYSVPGALADATPGAAEVLLRLAFYEEARPLAS